MHVILWIVVTLIIASPVLYVFIGEPTATYWDSVFSGLTGTATALIGGIPIALWVNRFLKRKEDEKEHNKHKIKEKGLLRLLKEELVECVSSLQTRASSPNALITKPIKSSFWQAASQGGKLNYFSNHSLLSKIASIYYLINVVQETELLCFKAINSAAVSYDNGTTAQQNLLGQCSSHYAPLSTELISVIRLIDMHINSIENA